MDRLRQIDEADVNVMLIGHNPGLHELAVALAGKNSPNFRALACGKLRPAEPASGALVGAWLLAQRAHRLRHAGVAGPRKGPMIILRQDVACE
jgi:phosphohistidine phosphatase SixA